MEEAAERRVAALERERDFDTTYLAFIDLSKRCTLHREAVPLSDVANPRDQLYGSAIRRKGLGGHRSRALLGSGGALRLESIDILAERSQRIGGRCHRPGVEG